MELAFSRRELNSLDIAKRRRGLGTVEGRLAESAAVLSAGQLGVPD